MQRTFIALCLLAATAAAQAAGRVEVTVKPLDQLRDAGRGTFDGERNVKLLTEHIKSLGQRLPDDQTLAVEVLDLDMAGELRPTRRGDEMRVMKGGADWPSMSLRWTLKAGDRTLDSREERISDMNYLMNPLRGRNDIPLAYELRMVDRWFDERFGAKAIAVTKP